MLRCPPGQRRHGSSQDAAVLGDGGRALRLRLRRLLRGPDVHRARRARGTGSRSRRSRAGRSCSGRPRAPRRGARRRRSGSRRGSARASAPPRRGRQLGRLAGGGVARSRRARSRSSSAKVASWTSRSASWAATSVISHGAVSPESTTLRPGRGLAHHLLGADAVRRSPRAGGGRSRAPADAELARPARRRSARGAVLDHRVAVRAHAVRRPRRRPPVAVAAHAPSSRLELARGRARRRLRRPGAAPHQPASGRAGRRPRAAARGRAGRRSSAARAARASGRRGSG